MKNASLIEILKTFSIEEMKKFGEMISLPYFNKQTPLIKLFGEIKKYYPDFKNDNIRKETVYSKMFPDKKFNYGSMKNYIFELQKLSEIFIADKEMKKNKFELKKSLINGLRERNLISLSEKNIKELEKEISDKEISEEDYFLKLYSINKIKKNHIFESSQGKNNNTEKTIKLYFEYFFTSLKYLKKYYLLITLRSYNSFITNKNIVNTEQAIRDCNEFVNLYKTGEFEDVSLKLEFNFLKMNLGNITEAEFISFKKLVLIDLYELKTDKDVTYAYSIYLLNYCRVKNKTDKKYLGYGFEIIKNLADKNNFDNESGYMDISLARIIVVVATQLKEFIWFEKFLNQYLTKIHFESRENIVNFYYALKYFYQDIFDKSLEYLSKLKFDDIFSKSYIKELQIINYFELEYFDLLNEQIDSYKKFLANNNRLPDSYKTQSIIFTDYMNTLIKAASRNKTDLFILKKKIQNEAELKFKDWFLKKLSEMELQK